uniref:Mitotic spindle checkpoint protein MAD1 n=1 Tax=Vitis vinifera TaxID=29760 RepID=A5AXP6_VITVI|nr:hypothetical protein VITISV_010896 [Vitis vinifera]
MILRTPPPRKRRADDSRAPESPGSDRRLVIYEDPVPESSHGPSEQMLCTYQCRQMVKAEFLESLNSAEKQVCDYQSRLEASNENFCKAEADRKKFRDQFFYAEQELAAVKGREKALQEQLLKEVNDSQGRFKKQIQSYSELEGKLQNEMNLRKNAESSAALAEEKASALEGKLSQFSESIEREKKRLQNELAQLKRESKLSVSRISADLERMECRANNAEKESELLKEQLEELKSQLNECLHQKSEAEKKLSSCTSQEVTTSMESDILVKHLQEELRNYAQATLNYSVLSLVCKFLGPDHAFVTGSLFHGSSQLQLVCKLEDSIVQLLFLNGFLFCSYASEGFEVREARKLKSSHENIELLKEKLLEEKGRRERAESELLKLPEIQLSMKKLEDELLSWKLMVKDIPGVSCSDDVPMKFAALQKEVIEGMMKLGEANARLKQMEVSLDAAEHAKQNVETEAALAKESSEVSKSELGLVTEERDQLRNAINELKKQKNVEAGDETKNGTLLQSIFVGLQQQEFELSLAKKENCIKELENNLCEQKEVNNRRLNEIKLLNEKLNNEARRIKSLEREGDRLRSEISLLESKLGHGDFSATNTKVLRMVNTLAVDNEAKQTIEALQTELQKAKEKLEAIEELKTQSADSGKLVDSYVAGKIVQFKEQIATLEKREERYKTVFADRISVFRRACCELFGYKVLSA